MLARAYAATVGAAGFLFGQLFFGTFSVGATLVGLGGVAAGTLGGWTDEEPRPNRAVFVACIVALIGVVMDAYHYYTELDGPGNYYAWFLTGPFVACLLLIAFYSRARASEAHR